MAESGYFACVPQMRPVVLAGGGSAPRPIASCVSDHRAAVDRQRRIARRNRAGMIVLAWAPAGGTRRRPGGGTLGVSCTPQDVKVQGETDITVVAGSALADVFTATSCLKIDNTFNVMPAR